MRAIFQLHWTDSVSFAIECDCGYLIANLLTKLIYLSHEIRSHAVNSYWAWTFSFWLEMKRISWQEICLAFNIVLFFCEQMIYIFDCLWKSNGNVMLPVGCYINEIFYELFSGYPRCVTLWAFDAKERIHEGIIWIEILHVWPVISLVNLTFGWSRCRERIWRTYSLCRVAALYLGSYALLL